jgi:hypothetical protein
LTAVAIERPLEEQSEGLMFERIATVVNKAFRACLQKAKAVWTMAI